MVGGAPDAWNPSLPSCVPKRMVASERGGDRGFLSCPMSDPIAIIPKTLDIRVYIDIDGKSERVPTKKGVTLRPDLIPELIKALESARSLPDAA